MLSCKINWLKANGLEKNAVRIKQTNRGFSAWSAHRRKLIRCGNMTLLGSDPEGYRFVSLLAKGVHYTHWLALWTSFSMTLCDNKLYKSAFSL